MIAGGSLIRVGALSGTGSVIAFQMDKVVVKKVGEIGKARVFGASKTFLNSRQGLEGIGGWKVSEDEFKEIHEEKRKYDMQRSEITENTKTLDRQSKNSSSTKKLGDQLAIALKALKKR